jgi:hypothetical protein
MGVAVYSEHYDWGTTTPAIGTSFPDYINIMICSWGPTLCTIDKSGITDGARMGTPVYESALAGTCQIGAFGAWATEIDTETDGSSCIGFLLDLQAGNQGTGTGGADNDLVEIFFNMIGGVGLIST